MEQNAIHARAGEYLDRRPGMWRVVVIRDDVLKRAPLAATGDDVTAHFVVVTAADPAIAHAAAREKVSIRVAVAVDADRRGVAANVFDRTIRQPRIGRL